MSRPPISKILKVGTRLKYIHRDYADQFIVVRLPTLGDPGYIKLSEVREGVTNTHSFSHPVEKADNDFIIVLSESERLLKNIEAIFQTSIGMEVFQDAQSLLVEMEV